MEQRPEPVALGEGIQAGTYTQIISIVAPASAGGGSRVPIKVQVRNKYSGLLGIMVSGLLEYGGDFKSTIDFPNEWLNIPSGTIWYFEGSFVMAPANAVIHCYTYVGLADRKWHLDDELTKPISLSRGTASFQSLHCSYAKV